MDEKPDIVRVLDYYAGLTGRDINLRQASGKAKINCPFHDDTHPSAVVNLETERFRCFANCGAPDGDSYDIIMGQEGIGFNDAKRWARDHIGHEGSEVRTSSSSGRYRPAFGPDDDD
jgi:DNA primase